MTKITRKLLLSIITVVLTVVALGTTTFAWFTLTNTSVVQAFEAEIVADTGIEIALNDGSVATEFDWKTTITTADVANYIEGKYGEDEFRFNHLTSPNGRVFYDLGTDGVGDSTTSGLLELRFHFRSEDSSAINWTNVALTSGAAPWQSGITFVNEHGIDITPGSSFSVDAADAMRLSITGNVGSLIKTTVYENPSSETNIVLGGSVDVPYNFENGGVGTNGSVNYFYQVNTFLPGGADEVFLAPTITSVSEVKVLDMQTGQVENAGAEYYGSITVRIWFEGWDANSYNALLGRIITASLKFAA